MERNNKRVLLINGSSIKESNSTSITINSLLGFFEKENLIELHYFPVINKYESCLDFKSLELKKETKFIYNIISKIYKGDLKKNITTRIVDSEVKSKPSLLEKSKKMILAYNDYFKANMRINNKITEEIVDFKPDVIYTLGASIFSLELAKYYSDKLNIPIVLHHMDNWRETTYSSSIFLRLPRRKLLKKLSEVESRMNFGMTISDEMAEIYSKISGNKYYSLMHTVKPLSKPDDYRQKFNQLNIVYAGGLHLERWKTLKQIEDAITNIKDSDIRITLDIYTKNSDRHKYSQVYNQNIVQFHDFLPHDEVYKIYDIADILIHVESFDPQLIKFTKYSLSTKIPEYMSSGKPILCLAPKEISSSKYIMDTRTGIAVTNFNELSEALDKMIRDKTLRLELGNNGIKTAMEKHSDAYKNKIMRTVFQS